MAEEEKKNPMVWVTDKAGTRFLCPLDALKDPNTVSEDEKAHCLEDASKLWKGGAP